jgi:hypothetical protein
MIDGSAAAPPLLLQLVLQQETKLTGTDVVVATKEALKIKKKRMEHKEVCSLALIGGEGLFLDPRPPRKLPRISEVCNPAGPL